MNIDDRVRHKKWGLGVIENIEGLDSEQPCARVRFDGGQVKMIALSPEYLQLSDAPLPDLSEDSWPLGTFIFEDESLEHDYAMRWLPFTDDAPEFLEQLMQTHDAWQHKVGWSLQVNKVAPQRHYWPNLFKGSYMISPHVMHGLCVRVEKNEEHLEPKDWFAYVQQGTQCDLTIDSVSVWHNQSEAILTTHWNEHEICFYDTAYLHNRDWYRAACTFSFLLTGIAMHARRDEPQTFEIKHPPERLAQMNARLIEQGQEPLEAIMNVSTQGMAAWLPHEWDRNAYEFRGAVRAVRRLSAQLGQHTLLAQDGWLVDVSCIREVADEELALTVLITEKIWPHDDAPQVDEDVTGVLYLQGELLYA